MSVLFLPRGFPLDDVHAWSNTILPAIAAVGLTTVLVQAVRSNFLRASSQPLAFATAAIAGAWASATISGMLFYPISIGLDRAIGPFAIALLIGLLAWATRVDLRVSTIALGIGLGVGVFVTRAQQAPPASTHPTTGTLLEVKGDPVREEAATGQVSFPCGVVPASHAHSHAQAQARIRPLLTFESRSPDGTWSLLAPPDAFGPRRKLEAFARDKNGFRAKYIDDGETTLQATKDAKDAKTQGLDIDAVSKLPHMIHSHLNAFTTIHVPFEAIVTLSPFPSHDIIPPEFTGKAGTLELAYLSADGDLHLVRASESEKGPYIEQAKGHLGREAPLTIGLRRRDGSKGSCSLTFKDWAAQVSTELSPTAGWGVPQNSIQLMSTHGKETFILLTLAETGPGRGFLTVTHAPGTYRNRVRIDTQL